ncbi:MAG: hypothetical protein A2252_08480 [Elusimicrobia bacterium RIFOXYA2_FULL_39_19]|nr:MAG: hypothetical protein A2252_08480 [Elusimicrobia bacterium RIFOXYA2_FULL_39_19]
MKIKKFKVTLRKKEIFKNLKLTSEIKEYTPEIDEAISGEIDKSAEYLSPASIFETFQIEEAKSKFGLSFDQKPKPVAVSVIVVSIGSGIESKIKTSADNNNEQRKQILNSLGLEACTGSLAFVYRILSEEATEDDCHLLALEKQSGDMEKNILNNIDIKSIDVSIDEAGNIKPQYFNTAIVKWLPKSKK